MNVLIASDDGGEKFYVISAMGGAPVMALWFSDYDTAVKTCEAAGFTVLSYHDEEDE